MEASEAEASEAAAGVSGAAGAVAVGGAAAVPAEAASWRHIEVATVASRRLGVAFQKGNGQVNSGAKDRGGSGPAVALVEADTAPITAPCT